MSSGRLEFGGNTADLEVSEPGTGPIKAKTRYIVRNIGLFKLGGNTADLEVSEPGIGAHKSKNPPNIAI